VGVVKALTIRRSQPCKRSRQSVSISQSRFFRSTASTAEGQAVIRRQLKRRYVLAFFQKIPSCLVGIEACGSSHHWLRELQALGHKVRLMPPAYVRPYVKRQKNDAANASDKRLPEIARACLAALGAQLRILKAQILEFDRMINAWHRSNETSSQRC
jgi:hypothetical protein